MIMFMVMMMMMMIHCHHLLLSFEHTWSKQWGRPPSKTSSAQHICELHYIKDYDDDDDDNDDDDDDVKVF